jgi:hypothetical protein
VGSLASIWGIVITLIQVIDAKRVAAEARDASEAAKVASEATSRELRNSYYRSSLMTARRLMSEIRTLLREKNWPVAAIRADDLGDHASQLVYLRPQPDQDWVYVRKAMPAWAIIFRSGIRNRKVYYDEAKWAELCDFVNDKIDREHDPLERTDLMAEQE